MPHLLAAILALSTALALAEAPDFAALAKQADHYSLPKPPADSKLVLGNTGSTTVIANSSTALDPGIYEPGFLLKEKADGSAIILAGFGKQFCKSNRKHRPATRTFTANPPEKKLGGYSYNGDHLKTFACAVQCARRGDLKNANSLVHLWNQSEYKDGFFTRERTSQFIADPRLLLARITFGYYYNRVREEDAKLDHCLAMLDQLQKEFPALFSKNPRNYFPFRYRKFIEDLRLTIKSPAPKPNSVEFLLQAHAIFDPHSGDAHAKDPIRKIHLMGTQALPELARLSTSQKLTRHENPGIMSQAANRERLGDIASSTISDMVGANHPTSQRFVARDWKQWITSAKLDDEKQFFTDAIKPVNEKKFSYNLSVPLFILSTKYPETLLENAKKFSTSDDRSEFIPLIITSKLDTKAQIQAIKTLYRTQRGLKRRYMLQNLATLDPQATIKELLPLIKKLPKDTNKPYWTCPEANLTHVIMQLEDDAIWKAFLAKTKTCAIGLRMELMNPMNYSYVKETNRARRLAFLAAFLDDTEVRTVSPKSKKWDGPHAGFTYDTLSVQNFVAEKIASILKVPGEPSEFWSNDQWSAFRKKVKKALTKETLPNFN